MPAAAACLAVALTMDIAGAWQSAADNLAVAGLLLLVLAVTSPRRPWR